MMETRQARIGAAVTGLLGSLLVCSSFAAAPDVYVVDAKVLAIPTERVSDVAVVGDHVERNGSTETVTIGSVKRIRLGRLELEIDRERGLLWDGESEPPEDARVERLSEPRLRLEPGKRAVMVAASRLQYFEEREDGAYELREVDPEEAPGVEIGCTVSPADGNLARVDFDMKLVVLERRESVRGVSLDVGQPVMRATAFASSAMLANGEWAVLSSHALRDHDTEKGDLLLVVLRVQWSEG